MDHLDWLRVISGLITSDYKGPFTLGAMKFRALGKDREEYNTNPSQKSCFVNVGVIFGVIICLGVYLSFAATSIGHMCQ